MAPWSNISYGFLVEAEGKRVYVTGDLHGSLKDYPLEVLAEYVDVLITECSHCTAELLAEKLKVAKTGKVMVVHVSPAEKYEQLRAYKESFSAELLLPDDGDEYVI